MAAAEEETEVEAEMGEEEVAINRCKRFCP
jgi:hypothetical protein